MKYSDEQRIGKILVTGNKLMAFIRDRRLTAEDIMKDETLQWAITTPLYNIGEQVYQLSKPYKAARPDIPWLMIAGLRHRLVHDYESTNWSLICEVVFRELPELIEKLS